MAVRFRQEDYSIAAVSAQGSTVSAPTLESLGVANPGTTPPRFQPPPRGDLQTEPSPSTPGAGDALQIIDPDFSQWRRGLVLASAQAALGLTAVAMGSAKASPANSPTVSGNAINRRNSDMT